MSKSRPPVLHSPASLTTLSSTLSITVPLAPYIIDLALLPASATTYALSTSSPSSAICLYSATPSALTHTLSLPIGGNGPSSMRVAPNFNGRPALLSSQLQDGCVKVWDERNGQSPVLEFRPPKDRAILSFDVSPDGLTLAAGTDMQADQDASIFYWDPRNPTHLQRMHSSTHSDDITALHFHPARSDVLLSASTDGLLNLSDPLEIDEDEAVQAVANWGCSISRAGWTEDNGVWAASDMETFGLWNGDLDLVNDFGDVRNAALPGSAWKTDYSIDSRDYSSTSGPCGHSGHALFLGSNSGDIAVAYVADLLEAEAPTWTVRALLRHGHPDAVVRSVLWDYANNMLLSGDEAGRLTAWRFEDVDVEMVDATSGTKRGREIIQEDRYKRGKFYERD